MLWPVGQISKNGYTPVSQLLHSASAAVRAASSSSKIIVHLANGWKSSAMTSFYKNVFIQGAFSTSDFDVMAFSMYPFYDSGATLANLKSSLKTLVSSYNKVRLVYLTGHSSVGSKLYSSTPSGCLPCRDRLACRVLRNPNRAQHSEVGFRPSHLGMHPVHIYYEVLTWAYRSTTSRAS